MLLLFSLGTGQAATIDLEPLVTGLARPVAIAHAGDGSARLFLVLQEGQVLIYDGTEVLPTPFLDIAPLVSCCGERGLLGIAFPPHYRSSGFFFVNYTNTAGNTVIARYRVSADPNVADPASATILLTIPQPFANHNGGQLQFGPDGYLYIGTGDGGAAGDPQNNAQNLGNLLGKLLRIDVDNGEPYTIPPDNPFVGKAGAREEIWAFGLRNPWRFSFDRLTGDLFIADVGQDRWEEVDWQPATSPGGENYGWRRMEGKHCFLPSTNCNDGTLTLPILEYSHEQGCSIIGGYRYRGSQIPWHYGTYFYADYCSGRIWGAREEKSGRWTSTLLLETGLSISTFGQDEKGELYLAHYSESDGTLYRLKGKAPLPPLCNIQMSQPTYRDGDTVTASVVQIANPGPSPLAVEIKVWLESPASELFSVLNRGADGSLLLPPETEKDFGPVSLFRVRPAFARGEYALNCRVLHPITGATLVLDQNRFSLQ
ncbi:MAG: glucose dehydrogenase [Nitrospinota bacterium]|nr:MAG: glucose dehydrogenase [Nitrospinota bacterium]